jgi:hypothetical protein
MRSAPGARPLHPSSRAAGQPGSRAAGQPGGVGPHLGSASSIGSSSMPLATLKTLVYIWRVPESNARPVMRFSSRDAPASAAYLRGGLGAAWWA